MTPRCTVSLSLSMPLRAWRHVRRAWGIAHLPLRRPGPMVYDGNRVGWREARNLVRRVGVNAGGKRRPLPRCSVCGVRHGIYECMYAPHNDPRFAVSCWCGRRDTTRVRGGMELGVIEWLCDDCARVVGL
jgi:hypothetical protein